MSNAQTVYAPYTTNTIQSGNSSDAGVTFVIDSRQFTQSVSVIKNTGATNSLTVSILTRVLVNGINTIQEISPVTLTPGSTVSFISDNLMSTIEVAIASASPGNPSSYLLESFGRV